MVVNSHNQEFGYELLSAVPYAYELYLKGELTETISAKGSEPLYFFSPKHTINDQPRDWANTLKCRGAKGLPYTTIHQFERPELKFPNYKEQYANDVYKWKKPTLCICNRYNKEWNQEPINYFDVNMLEWLFSNLKKQYEIVYFAVDLPDHIQDNAPSMQLNDIEVAKKHKVKIFQEIKGECWNTSLLQVFANCENYITMNGGYSILASFFTGSNLIYTTRRGNYHCHELTYKSFFRWYPNHNNQRVYAVEGYEALKEMVSEMYINCTEVANIIIRTSNRPNAFAQCIKSVEKQTYKNKNIIVVTDDKNSFHYTREHNARHIHFENLQANNDKPTGDQYGVPFKPNLLLKEALKRIESGFVIYLDDDDMFTADNSLEIIMSNVEENKLLVWKTDFNGKIIPNGNFGKQITLFDITGIGFSHAVKHKNLTDWSEWKRADYRTAKKLSDNMPVKWLDAVLTKLQSKPGNGKRIDISPKNSYMKTVKVLNPIIGKVGTLKRLTSQIAAKVVADGHAEYISDVVDKLNGKAEVVGKPVVTENKQAVIELENKAQNGTQSNNNGDVPAENGSGKELFTANKPKGRSTNSGTNRGRNKKG